MKLLGRNKDDSEGAGGADDSRKQGSSLDVDATSTARDARQTGRPRAVRKAAAGMLGTGSQATDALLAWGLMGGL